MNHYVGVMQLTKIIPCLKEVSGKIFKSKIAGYDVGIIFPSIPDNYQPDQINIQKGNLVVPENMFKGSVNWGMVTAWPSCLFSVHAVICYTHGDVDDINAMYQDFPRWKEKLSKLLLINTGNYSEPEQKIPSLIQGGGFDDGLRFFEASEAQGFKYVRNCRETEPIRIHITESKESFSVQQLTELFFNVGYEKEIALPHELMISAYRAMERHDFRSAVILGGTAVEQAAIKCLRTEYSSNRKFKMDESKQRYRMLGGKFRWLEDKMIPIPISDYKKSILDIRNNATHEGICPPYNITKECLENCKILVDTYHPNVLEE